MISIPLNDPYLTESYTLSKIKGSSQQFHIVRDASATVDIEGLPGDDDFTYVRTVTSLCDARGTQSEVGGMVRGHDVCPICRCEFSLETGLVLVGEI